MWSGTAFVGRLKQVCVHTGRNSQVRVAGQWEEGEGPGEGQGQITQALVSHDKESRLIPSATSRHKRLLSWGVT